MKITRTRIFTFLGIVLLWVVVLYITSGSHVVVDGGAEIVNSNRDSLQDQKIESVSSSKDILSQKNIITIQSPEVLDVRERCGEFWCYTGEDFLRLYDQFEARSGLRRLGKYVYNKAKIDGYLISKAIDRGYQRRVFANEDDIVSFEGRYTRPEVRDAFISMREAMAVEISDPLHFVSGYRNSTKQRSIVLGKLGTLSESKTLVGQYDAHIDDVLRVSALPGFSKHHSGYAVDLGCGEDKLVFSFATTPCYDWLSKDNFQNAKRFGFIPSYPEGVSSQGPNPEPWEFVWVGSESLH